MENPLTNYSDEDFLSLLQEFETLSEPDKVLRLWELCPDGQGLLVPITRTIKRKQYHFGFMVKREEQAQYIARILHKRLAEQKFASTKKAFAVLLENCQTQHEQMTLLEQSIKQNREAIEDLKDTFVYRGYNTARLKQEERLYSWQGISFSNALTDTYYFFSVVSSASDGHVVYLMEVYLTELLAQLRQSTHPTLSPESKELQRNLTTEGHKPSTRATAPSLRPRIAYSWDDFFVLAP